MLWFWRYQKGFPNNWVSAHLILSGIIKLIKLKKKHTRTLIGVTKEGDFYMTEFESMNKALKASWVKRSNNDTD